MDKSVSVIIPLYNSKDTIIKTLNSVIEQTALSSIKEVIIVNDGSTDNSLSLVEEYAHKNSTINLIIINKNNEGVSSARNAGMRIAKGKYIALLDSDDIWFSNKLERQLEILKSHPEIDFLGCSSDKKGLKILLRKIDSLYKANVKDLCIKYFPATPTAIFKRAIIDKIGYFDEGQMYCEDMNYFSKICYSYNYYYLPENLVELGGGKPAFGHIGLSANLQEMQKGAMKNLKELRDSRVISSGFYILMWVFYQLKYIRRIIITKIRRLRQNKLYL